MSNADYDEGMFTFVAIGVVIAFVIVLAARVDIRDRRRGRKSRIRMASFLERAGQVSASNSPEAYLFDTKGFGSGYSPDVLRGEHDREHRSD